MSYVESVAKRGDQIHRGDVIRVPSDAGGRWRPVAGVWRGGSVDIDIIGLRDASDIVTAVEAVHEDYFVIAASSYATTSIQRVEDLRNQIVAGTGQRFDPAKHMTYDLIVVAQHETVSAQRQVSDA